MNQADYINLVHKQLSGEISEKERTLLREWISLNEANKEMAEELTYVWENVSFAEMQSLPEAEILEGFEALEARIDEEEKKSKKVIPLFQRKWAVAATLLLVVGISGFALFQSFNKDVEWAEYHTQDESKEILLADGSIITLNANSSLKYPTEFNQDQREVEFQGEAFFDIARDPEHPFIVHTPYEDVTVLGTSFNVRSYDGETNSEVTVATGKVEVVSPSASTVLLPNEKVIVSHENGDMNYSIETTMNEIAWMTGELNFDNTPLAEVEVELERFYSISIEIENNNLINCPLNADFDKNEELATVLETIETIFGVSIEQNGNNYRFTGGQLCE